MQDDKQGRVRVWDAPVRAFHWLMVLSFAGAWLTGESERWRYVHVTLGYTMAGLVAFRVLWGLIGTRHARFASFVRGPRAVTGYLGSMLAGRPPHHVGHNPAGAWAIVALLTLVAMTAATGWAAYNELAGEWLEELHEGLANLTIAMVGVHLAGVVVGSLMHRENLVRSMITGFKRGAPSEGIRWSWWPLAAALLVAVLGFWSWQATQAPAFDATATQRHKKGHDRDHDHDDD